MDRAARAARSGRGSVSRGQGRATRRTTGFGNARRAGGGGGRGTALGTGRLRGIIRTRRAGTRQNASRLDPERLSLAARPATPFRRVDPDDEDDDDSLPDYVNDNGQDPNDSDDSGSGDSNHGDGDYQHHGHVGGKRKTEAVGIIFNPLRLLYGGGPSAFHNSDLATLIYHRNGETSKTNI